VAEVEVLPGYNQAISMTAIRYELHFLLLSIAACAYVVLGGILAANPLLLYGLMGAFHATTIVASLREQGLDNSWKAVFFIALAGVWSIATYFLAMMVDVGFWPVYPKLTSLQGSFVLVFIFLVGSAIGSSGYWLMVRLFWVKSLRLADWFRTVALCLAATFSACMMFGGGIHFDLDNFKTDLPWTITWWFAFSLSLYWSETRKAARTRLQSIESAS